MCVWRRKHSDKLLKCDAHLNGYSSKRTFLMEITGIFSKIWSRKIMKRTCLSMCALTSYLKRLSDGYKRLVISCYIPKWYSIKESIYVDFLNSAHSLYLNLHLTEQMHIESTNFSISKLISLNLSDYLLNYTWYCKSISNSILFYIKFNKFENNSSK